MAEQRSLWAYVGIGCLILGALGLIAAVGGGFAVWRATKSFTEELKDPSARERKVLDVLGAEALPEGYYPVMALSMPFGVFEVAILSDEEPDASGEVRGLGSRGLIYVQAIYSGQDEQELRDYFEGRTSDPGVLRRNNINISSDEIIDRGVVAVDNASLMYVAQRGSVSAHGFQGGGITSVILVDCPEDEKMRMAIWFTPEPEPSPTAPDAEPSLEGTPADEAAIADFIGRFRLCEG